MEEKSDGRMSRIFPSIRSAKTVMLKGSLPSHEVFVITQDKYNYTRLRPQQT